MSEIGEVRYGYEIGKVKWHKYVWQACVKCSKERWVKTTWGIPDFKVCMSCSLAFRKENSRHWKGGKHIDHFGYVMVRLSPDDFFYPMTASNGYVREHRLVVAKALGRNLQSWELVHHKGVKYPLGSVENKQDNRYPENLQLVMELQHKQLTRLENKIDSLIENQRELKAEIRLLRFENKQLREVNEK